ncbi:hypothetical protein BGZ73_001425, partial [Actinomortierella ambigua]
HSLLTIELRSAHNARRRKTVWRLNTQILKDGTYGPKILEAARALSVERPGESLQEHWDRWKAGLRSTCIRLSARRNRARKDHLQELKDLHAGYLDLHAKADRTTQLWISNKLAEIGTDIQTLVTETLQGKALKAGLQWREKGETSSGYFFRSIAARRSRRRVPDLLDPSTNSLTNSVEGQLDVARRFYSTLYTPEDADGDIDEHIARMVSAIPEDRALSEDTQEQLIAPIDATTILTQ